MMVLMGLVIAMFIIVGAYVGYHASQDVPAEGHDATVNLEALSEDSNTVQIPQNPEQGRSVIDILVPNLY